MGAWVVSPLPLDDNAPLRFQVMDSNRDAVISKLASWDWALFPSAFCRVLRRAGGKQRQSTK
jgi:hypothetical protein